MELSEFRKLNAGDKVRIAPLDVLQVTNNVHPRMHKYADTVVTVRRFRPSDPDWINIEEDSGEWVWKYNMLAEVVEKVQIDLSILPATRKYKYDIRFSDRDCEYRTNRLRLYKIVADVQRLLDHGNSPKFSRIIAGKWVVVDTYNNRVMNAHNPHILEHLENERIRNYRIDNLSYLYEQCVNYEHWTDPVTLTVDFKNGKFLPKTYSGKNICKLCGTHLTKENRVGRFCHDCLTKTNGLAYRYSYHEFGGNYTQPQGIDTTKVPIFGCEIERDYIGEYYSSDYSEKFKKAMIGVVKATQEEQLKKGILEREQVFMSDGSLNRGGIEWITFPHTFDWYVKNKDKIDKALAVFEENELGASIKAGNHIHINRDFFKGKNDNITDESDFAGAKMAVLINKYWECFKKIAKRQDTNYTQKPQQNDTDSMFSIVKKTIRGKDSHSVAVNLQHDKTVEVRLWSAIETADDLLFFLDNMQALARYIKRRNIETIQSAKLTDFMKYYKLKTTLTEVKKRLDSYGTKNYATEVQQVIDKKAGK